MAASDAAGAASAPDAVGSGGTVKSDNERVWDVLRASADTPRTRGGITIGYDIDGDNWIHCQMSYESETAHLSFALSSHRRDKVSSKLVLEWKDLLERIQAARTNPAGVSIAAMHMYNGRISLYLHDDGYGADASISLPAEEVSNAIELVEELYVHLIAAAERAMGQGRSIKAAGKTADASNL